MEIPENLQDEHWQVVHKIAQMLVEGNTDVNELAKAIAYLRDNRANPQAGRKFFQYLSILVKNSEQISHSDKTPVYYKSIEDACKQHLQPYKNDIFIMIQILGWAKRLMRYYKKVGITSVKRDDSTEVTSSKALERPKNLERPKPKKLHK